MTELDGLDGWERLDPALRGVATARTNFSLRAVKLMREPFNDRRREAATLVDVSGLHIADHTARAEPASVLGATEAARRSRRRWWCFATQADSRWETSTPITASASNWPAAAAARWCRSTTGVPGTPVSGRARRRHHRAAVGRRQRDRTRRRRGPDRRCGQQRRAALAACLARGSADGTLPAVGFQLLHQPVLDDRATGSETEFGDACRRSTVRPRS